MYWKCLPLGYLRVKHFLEDFQFLSVKILFYTFSVLPLGIYDTYFNIIFVHFDINKMVKVCIFIMKIPFDMLCCCMSRIEQNIALLTLYATKYHLKNIWFKQ